MFIVKLIIRIDDWFKRLKVSNTITFTCAVTQVCLCTFQLTDITSLDKHLDTNCARNEVLTNQKRRFLVRLEGPKSFRFDQRSRNVQCIALKQFVRFATAV